MIDLTKNGRGYYDLLEHIGHKLICVSYGDHENPHNVDIECEDCKVILIDFNCPDLNPPEVEPEEKGNREIPDPFTDL